MKRRRPPHTTPTFAPALWIVWLSVAAAILASCDATIHQYPGYAASDDSPPAGQPDIPMPSGNFQPAGLVVLPVDSSGPYTMYKRVVWDGRAAAATDLPPCQAPPSPPPPARAGSGRCGSQ